MTDLQADVLIATAPLAGLVSNVVIHVAISHLVPSMGFLLRSATGVVSGALVTAVLSAVALWTQPTSTSDTAMLWLFAMLTFVALGFGYFNFVNLNVTSLRVRLLHELMERYPNGLTRDQIVQEYGAATVLRLRLQRLLDSGHVRRRGAHYYLARRRILAIAHIFTFLRWIVIPSLSATPRPRSDV